MFKDKNDYLNQRKTLLDNATKLINDGKIEDGNAVMEQIKDLDNAWENFAKAQANLQALNNPSLATLTNAIGTQAPQIADFENGGVSEQHDMYDTKEYRLAFMNSVMNGTPIKMNNVDANTKTSDVGSVIPTTIVNRIIEKMETVGKIYAKVTKTAFKGGVSIPTSATKPVASWVNEGAGSDKQKTTTGSITFTYHKLRCAISMSLETTVVTLEFFETAFVNSVTVAMIKAIEESIFNGTGVGQPKGILLETPDEGQVIEITEGSHFTYEKLLEIEAALPDEYDAGSEWYMRKKTYYSEILSLKDNNNQPIARVNAGIDGKPSYTLFGRKVNFTDYVPAFPTSVSEDTVVACIFNMENYTLNENLGMTVKRYTDEDTDDEITKAIMLVDGKVTDKHGLVTVVVKNS